VKSVSSHPHSRPDAAAILRVVASIPRGRVASYGEVAARAGLPRRARLVGHVLREAPDDLDLPWHRVLRADGRIAFPVGSRAHAQQRRLLAAEGVASSKGRVDMAMFGWERDLDALLWAPIEAASPSAARTSPGSGRRR
jgi:methylated-DNA-protein-cysteine methyltransferase related protein